MKEGRHPAGAFSGGICKVQRLRGGCQFSMYGEQKGGRCGWNLVGTGEAILEEVGDAVHRS